ncbi:type III PLP-dependent enzyme [Plantactinospora sp. S1510]|uniref:Type III PLP-dependent enzyme n=1 Tax=Plantactinospora alkalitolerans TaxID=2789879 RepID=A0ABS0GXJ0_9ACTN|nr:type III PLP-dependent enzyme [Plantactinospora alkalitolerans]MBF9130922.1 type III PLP-dependent enzyme [Plantactinospora alkalitolerans]
MIGDTALAAKTDRERLDELVRDYGTPLYVYRLDAVRDAVDGIRRSLPDEVRLLYSAKANPHPAILRAVTAHGAGLEVSSVGEVAAATGIGAVAGELLYTGPGKTVGEMTSAIRTGIRRFSVESLVDRDRLAASAGDSAVDYLVRINAPGQRRGAGLRMTGKPSQFGVDSADLVAWPELLRPVGRTRPVGFHIFSATNVPDEAALLTELETNIGTAVWAAEQSGFTATTIDIGGGFGAPYAAPGRRPDYPGLRVGLSRALDRALPGWRSGEPRVVVESGRHLVAESGTLLTTVLDVKTSGPHTYLVCDAGINALGGMHGLGRLLSLAAQPVGPDHDDTTSTTILVGPLCTPMDILSRSATVTRPAVGQVLAIPNVGAYGLTASLVAFLGRELPVEVVLDGHEVVDARRLSLTASAAPRQPR